MVIAELATIDILYWDWIIPTRRDFLAIATARLARLTDDTKTKSSS